MKKNIIFYFLGVLLFLPPAVEGKKSLHRGLFVTVMEEPVVFTSKEEITKLIDFAKKAHINTLFVQIYRANKAWFPSKTADSTPYRACLKNTLQDPFALLVKEAHGAGIEVYAWLNMLSLSNNKDAKLLKKYGPSILTRNIKAKHSLQDYKIDNQYFLEPADPRVRQELLKVVEEILKTYSTLDGILFDYIRYPDKNPAYGYTKINMERFRKATGIKNIEESDPVWKDWKRKQVNELVSQLSLKARSLRPNIKISATGCAPYSRALYEAYQDWPSWIALGLVDSVTFMNYFPDMPDFEKCILDIKKKNIDFRKINITVGAYKLLNSPQIFLQEFQFCEDTDGDTCIVFHYGSLLKNPVLGGFLIEDSKT